jgi:hypothetical protein
MIFISDYTISIEINELQIIQLMRVDQFWVFLEICLFIAHIFLTKIDYIKQGCPTQIGYWVALKILKISNFSKL